MTPRERWLAVLCRERPDRVPMDYWGTPEATEKVLRYLGCEDLWEMYVKLSIDAVVTVEPRYRGPPLRPGYDMYGCGYRTVRYATGAYEECVFHPLAQYQSVDGIAADYVWPSPDWFDYSVIPAQVEGKESYPVRGGGSEPFYRYTYLRGMQQAYIDLARDPEMVRFCLGKLFDFSYEYTTRIYEQIPCRVDISYISEDMGSQEGLLFSPSMIRELFLPGMKRMIELAHQARARAFCHSDGAIRPIIPDLIDIGVDILNPIQWRCRGMERKALKQDFGELLVFHGGVDNQKTLAFGSVEQMWEEVAYNLQVLGEGGGYILAPCHNIQAISPPENVVAMYEAGLEYG